MIIYEEILRDFQRQKVKYVIVGGIAMNLLGSFRNTADLDVLVEMSDLNLAKVIGILKKHGYRVKNPVDPMGIADAAIRKDWIENRHMRALNFYKNDLREVDILIDTPVDFKKAKVTAKKIKCGSIVLPVISIDNLLKMKRAAGRMIDKSDIAELKVIKKIEGKLK